MKSKFVYRKYICIWEYNLKKITCNLCGNKDYVFMYRIDTKKSHFDVVRCSKCRLVYVNPQPSSKEIENMYDKDYFHGHGFDEGIDYALSLKNREVWYPVFNSRLDNIERYVRKSNILDIGCGFGEFMMMAKKRGWKAKGIELSKYASGVAKKLDLDVFNGSIEKAKFKEKFSVLTMFEVVEHLPDPLKTLKECGRFIKDDGIFVIQTGDADSMYARFKGKKWPYLLAGHLHYFSRSTLTSMLKKAGFDVIHIYNGDEISLGARFEFIHLLKKKGLMTNAEYVKQIFMQAIRKIGVGGMTVYAKKS